MAGKKVRVDQAGCIGCGLCVTIAEGTFLLAEDGKIYVKEPVTDEDEKIQEAIDCCPVNVISWVDEE